MNNLTQISFPKTNLFLTLKKLIKYFLSYFECFYEYRYRLVEAIRRMSDTLELQSYTVVGLHLVLGIKPTSSGTITSVLNY